MAKILVIDDDPGLIETVADALTVESHEIESVNDGLEGLQQLKLYEYDLVIIDWNLPGLAGPEVCKRFRDTGNLTPVLMLTGNTKSSEKAEGLDSGADDYLVKPFAVDELRARIRALIRRATRSTSNFISSGPIKLDLKTRRVYKDEQELTLMAKELALLEFLLMHKGQVFTTDSLLERVWGYDSESSDLACRQCIARLRKKIEGTNGKSIIRTVVGVGYTVDA